MGSGRKEAGVGVGRGSGNREGEEGGENARRGREWKMGVGGARA